MSAKITSITLDGKQKTLTRARAQRLVDAGSHQWQGSRTIREIRQARAVQTIANRVKFEPDFFFDYPEQGIAHDIPGLPYTYPLPLWMLKQYRTVSA